MRTTRPILTNLLALSLAIAIPAAATAQDPAPKAPEVAYSTGSAAGGPARVVDGTEERSRANHPQMRGRSFIGIPIEFTDPRLSGLFTIAANGSAQDFVDGWATIESRTYRIENDDGAWAGSGDYVFAIGSDEPLILQESMVLVGEGAYDGLVAYMFVEDVNGEPGFEAVIVENQVAPAPEPITGAALASIPTFETIVDLDTFLTGFVGDADGGVSSLVVRDGETTIGTAGVANAEGDPMGIDTAFRVGSISKTFVATMVLQLVDEGLVDLDSQLSTYLPQTIVGGDVTVRWLLSHRSGIPSYTEQPTFFEDAFEDLERSWSMDEILGYVADVPAGDPDQAYSYSNTNYLLLGQLLEAVGGADLDTALQTRIVEPLGLKATTFDVDGSRMPDTLAGAWAGDYFHGDPTAAYESIASGAWSAGALVSTPSDLATFLAGLFGGRLIPDELLAEMLDVGPEGYGLGIASVLPDLGSSSFYGHNGGILGYVSFMAGDPESGDVVVVLSNNATSNPQWAGSEILRAWAGADA